ncbi:MAG: ZipA [Betaproteobacteria bacterium]|nr:ZipA [Betaproteobacteria bacterium]
MSDLQIGLLALGALVVVCVLAFNKFQEVRARREATRHFSSGHEDVLLKPGAGEQEPVPAGAAPAPRAWVEPTWKEEAEPALEEDSPPMPADAGTPSRPAVNVLSPPVLDERIDFIAELQFVEPLLGSHLVMEIEKFAAARIIGCDGFNLAAAGWEGLDRDSVYEMARIGIQLSDRGGPLRADELEQFQQWVGEAAARLGAMIDWSGMQSPLTRAAELDAFCAEVDVQIGVNLVGVVPLPETKVRGLAEAAGFKREDDGVFRRRDEQGGEVLALRQSAPVAISLLYDVPRVPREAAAFGMMMHCARTMAKSLDARIVDDNGRLLDDSMQGTILSRLGTIHARMEAADMPAGGALAQRVFT